MNANGTASLSRNPGSPRDGGDGPVPSASFPITPWSRFHVSGLLTQASPPTITLYQEPAFGLCLILNRRRNVYLTSLGFSSLPFENLIPLRRVKTYVLPPSVGVGTEVA